MYTSRDTTNCLLIKQNPKTISLFFLPLGPAKKNGEHVLLKSPHVSLISSFTRQNLIMSLAPFTGKGENFPYQSSGKEETDRRVKI